MVIYYQTTTTHLVLRIAIHIYLGVIIPFKANVLESAINIDSLNIQVLNGRQTPPME